VVRWPRRPVLAALLLSLSPGPAIAGGERVIVVIGDSLTAGLGVARDEAYPALLEARLRREGFDYRVVNAGVSGDTTAGGLRRLTGAAFLAGGRHRGARRQRRLRGLLVAALRQLAAIITRARASGACALAGMRLPPNYGDAYASAFAQAFREVARGTATPLLPFLLEGVAGDPSMNQADGIHPNAAGQRAMAERIWSALEPLLRR
jgi:acyl-CoA thioesterase-1